MNFNNMNFNKENNNLWGSANTAFGGIQTLHKAAFGPPAPPIPLIQKSGIVFLL